MNELERKEVWTGAHRDIRFEIVRWSMGWNYYLIIQREQLPDELQSKFNLPMQAHKLGEDSPIRYSAEYESGLISSDLERHGGITYYEKQRNEIGKIISFKLGCDYMHSWDMHQHYTMESVLDDVKQSIDKLWELIPNMKVRCAYNGAYYPIEETFLTDKGVRVAYVNKEKWFKPI